MSYRSKISVNPNINVQGLQSDILANQHDLQLIQIENIELTNKWFVQQLVLFSDNKSIPAATHMASNAIHTLYLHPTQEITFFGGVSDPDVNVFIDISFDGSTWFDSNFPIVKNSSDDFSSDYHTQARYLRLRFHNSTSSAKLIEKSYAAYKFNKYKDKSGVITSLDANTSFVTQ
jgi:hypothetical protein